MADKGKIFWLDGFEGKAQGGIHYRTFDMAKFMNTVENKMGEVVGLRFEGNNCEMLFKPARGGKAGSARKRN